MSRFPQCSRTWAGWLLVRLRRASNLIFISGCGDTESPSCDDCIVRPVEGAGKLLHCLNWAGRTPSVLVVGRCTHTESSFCAWSRNGRCDLGPCKPSPTAPGGGAAAPPWRPLRSKGAADDRATNQCTTVFL